MGSGALYGPGGRAVGQNPAPGRPTRGERLIIGTLARFAKAHGPYRGRVPADAGTVCALAAIAWFAIAGAAQAETRVALVIGNSNYAAQRLKNPRNDAALMARTLAGVGFEVMTLMDASAADMRSAITEFGRRLQAPDTVALFYYAGHGVQAAGDNYLIPIGADISKAGDVASKAIALQSVFKTMQRTQARLNIVILDACRDNPFEAGGTAAPDGLAPVVAPSGTIIGYATAPGQVAQDGAGLDSPYTAALAANIPSAGVTLEQVFRAARRQVLDVTGNTQTPWEHSSLTSEFYFKPKTVEPETSERRGTGDAPADLRLAEIEAWEAIKASHDPELFKAHVARFPEGLFVELAAVRLANLAAMRAQTPWNWMMTGAIDRDAGTAAAVTAYEKAVQLDARSASATDLQSAAKLYAEAAAEGLPAAMFSLARAYDKGRGVAKDLETAAHWYGLAADKDHAAAMAALGTMQEFGEGTASNLASALRLYQLAADAGDPSGQTSLGYLYAQGKGVVRDASKARQLYEQAAAKGHPRAMFNLALMDLRGDGGKRDLANAVKLLESAARKGHAGALQELAFLYDEGRGVARSAPRAAGHLLQALKAAHTDGRTIEVNARAWSLATRREVQRRLAAQGFYRGAAHGYFNEATHRALIASAQ